MIYQGKNYGPKTYTIYNIKLRDGSSPTGLIPIRGLKKVEEIIAATNAKAAANRSRQGEKHLLGGSTPGPKKRTPAGLRPGNRRSRRKGSGNRKTEDRVTESIKQNHRYQAGSKSILIIILISIPIMPNICSTPRDPSFSTIDRTSGLYI